MNRAERRREAAKVRPAAQRHEVVRQALAYMATSPDLTISGCTVMLADGQTLYLDADTARAMRPAPGRQGGGTC